MRPYRFARAAAAFAATAMLLAACDSGGSSGGDSSDEGAESVYPGVTQLQVYEAISVWGTGCEIFNDLQPLLYFWGAEGSPNSEPEGDYFPSCEGSFDLGTEGNARAEFVLRSYETHQEATEYYADAIGQGAADREGDDVSEGVLAGEWNESHYWTKRTEFGQSIDGYGRYGNWVIFFNTYADGEPPSSDFTLEEYVSFVTEEYLPGIKSDIDEKFEE